MRNIGHLMVGLQAKVLTPENLSAVLKELTYYADPERSRVMVFLSAKAGLRAAEIAISHYRKASNRDEAVAGFASDRRSLACNGFSHAQSPTMIPGLNADARASQKRRQTGLARQSLF